MFVSLFFSKIFSLLLVASCLLPLAYFEEPAPPWQRHAIDRGTDEVRGADGVRLADVNGDGLLDIATPWEEGGLIKIYLNPGHNQSKDFWPQVTVGKVGSPEDAVFADLDGDGAIDVISSSEGEVKTLSVHWAPKEKIDYLIESAWETESIPAAMNQQQWMFALPMQLDGKYGLDLVAGGKNRKAQIGWFEAPENPRELSAWQWHSLYDAGWVMSLVAADLDRDGDLDLIASDHARPKSRLSVAGESRFARSDNRKMAPASDWRCGKLWRSRGNVSGACRFR